MKLLDESIGGEEHEGHSKEMHEHEKQESQLEETSGVFTCPMDSHSHIVQFGPGECSECGMKLVPAEETSGRTAFVCPMPEDSVVSAEPGRCSKCGMKLVEEIIGGSKQ
jgi:predicted RNA-binding Zn-ribbon protein involved in translation (DUF1610 family)